MVLTLENLIELFSANLEETSPSTLSGATNFREIPEWDSIVALSVIASIDEAFGIQLNAADMQNSKTIDDIFQKLQTKVFS